MKRKLHSFFFIIFFDQISLNITFPVLSFVFFDPASSLFAPDATHAQRSHWYGVCLALAFAGNLISAPLLSWLSDVWGRRKLLLLAVWGALIYALFSAFGILFGSLLLLLTGKLIGGFFARTDPLAQAVVADLSTSENRMTRMSYLQATIALGACLGPLLGGYFAKTFFATLNFSFSFFIAAGFAIASIMAAFAFFQETNTERVSHKKIKWDEVKSLLTPDILRLSGVLILVQLSWSSYYQFIPAVIKNELQFSPHAVGLFVGLIALWLTIAALLFVKRLQSRWREEAVVFYASIVMLSGFMLEMIAVLMKGTQWGNILTWVAALPIAMGDVVIYSALTALYANKVSGSEYGKVMGFCFVLVALVWMSTALLGGVLAGINVNLPLMVAPFGLILYLSSRRFLC